MDLVTVTRMENENYSEMEPQERTRYVTRQYHYFAWKHKQALELGIAGKLGLQERALEISLSQHAEADGIEHDENLPHMNLAPSRPNLINAQDWIKDQSNHLAKSLEEKLVAL